MINSFEPIIADNCKVLILGTMPSEESLRRQQYYGYNRNHFWKIIFTLLGVEPTENYEEKQQLLLSYNIGLWDVLKACDRVTSSDTKIKNPVPNDFKELLNEYKGVKYICFNGTKAEALFRKHVLTGIVDKELILFSMPSTSPANTQAYECKLEKWSILKELIK